MRKISRQSIAIIVLVLIVVSLLSVMILQNFVLNTANRPPQEDPKTDLVLQLEDYTVFDLEDLSFKFVIAKVKISSNDSINLGLENLTTSENVALNNVDAYRKSLESKGYDLSMMNVSLTDIISLENSVSVNLFIPIKSVSIKEVQLRVSQLFQSTYKLSIDPLRFNLNNPLGTKEMLGKATIDGTEPNPDGNESGGLVVPNQSFTFGELNEINPLSIYFDKEGILEPVTFEPGTKIYSVSVYLSSQEKTAINRARLSTDDAQKVFEPMSSVYVYEFGTNMFQRAEYYQNGYLLFAVGEKDVEILSQQSPLQLEYQVDDSQDWIRVDILQNN